MKITALELLKVPPSWVWLKLHTDEGLTGLGEPYLEGHPEAVMAEVRRLEPLLLGEDPRRVEYLWERMYTAGGHYRGGPVTMSAISGIDIALWDVAGKAAGVPVHRLLGGACRERVLVYHASGAAPPHCVAPGLPYRAGRTGAGAGGGAPDPGPRRRGRRPGDPAAFAAAARTLVQEWGYRCLKTHLGVGERLEATDRVGEIAERFAAVREGAGPDVPVAIDIHNPLPAIGVQLIEALAPLRPLFIEEPMPVERVEALAQMLRGGPGAGVPIAAGERWMGKWVFFDALSRGLLAVVQPDLCHAGGITECKKIAALAEAAYAQVALHCPLSPIAFAASVQLDAALPNFLVQEHNEVNNWREGGRTLIGKGYLAQPFALDEDGCAGVPDGPGLGIEPDEAGLQEVLARPWSAVRG
jgi:galactonate dehydratase